jgi:hypothetical protein
MSQLSDELGSRLARVVPDLDELDWEDVALRADLFGRAAARPSRWRRLPVAPRALVFALVVVLMGGSLALAVGGRVLHALDDGPAPARVKDEFRQFVRPPYPLDGAPPLPKGYLPGAIVKGSERRVLTIRTGPHAVAALYTARSSKGQTCFVSVGKPWGVRGCMAPSQAGPPFSVFAAQRGSYETDVIFGKKVTARHVQWQTLGRASDPAARTLRVVYADGTHHDVVLENGWFMYLIPVAHTHPGNAPIRFDVLSAAGARLGTRVDPFTLTVPRPHFTSPTPASVRLLASTVLPNDGGTVRIWAGRDASGSPCFRHLRNGISQVSPVWQCGNGVGVYGLASPERVGDPPRHVPVSWQLGLRNDPRKPVGYGYAYAFGWVGPKVARLSVRFQGGASVEIPLHERFFVYSVAPEHWAAGRRPSILEARDGRGMLVYKRFLYPRQHCIYPGSDPRCRNYGQGTG